MEELLNSKRGHSAGLYASIAVGSAAALLHVLTFFVDLPFAHAFIFLFILLSMLCVASMLMSGPGSQRRAAPIKTDVLAAMSDGFENTVSVVRAVPRGALLGFVVVAIYFTVNFLFLIQTMWSGSPAELNGEFLLMDHGRLVRRLDRAEFLHLESLEARGTLGHPVMFSLIAALGYVVRDRRGTPGAQRRAAG
jgi:hypothetical protein